MAPKKKQIKPTRRLRAPSQPDTSEKEHPLLTLYKSVPISGTQACKTFYLEMARRPIVSSGGPAIRKVQELIEMPLQDNSPELTELIDEIRRLSTTEYPELKRIEVADTVCEQVNNYLVYLTDLISTILQSNPSALRSTKTVTVEEVLKSKTMDEFIEDQVEQEISSLAQKGFPDIKKYVEGFGLNLISDRSEERHIFRGVHDRNLFTHQRGIVNKRYITRLESQGFDVSNLYIGMHLADSTAYPPAEILTSTVRSVAFLEKNASSKYSLPLEEIGLNILLSGDPSNDELNEIISRTNLVLGEKPD